MILTLSVKCPCEIILPYIKHVKPLFEMVCSGKILVQLSPCIIQTKMMPITQTKFWLWRVIHVSVIFTYQIENSSLESAELGNLDIEGEWGDRGGSCRSNGGSCYSKVAPSSEIR